MLVGEAIIKTWYLVVAATNTDWMFINRRLLG